MVDDVALACGRFRPDALGVEANQYQELLGDEIKRALQARHARRIEPTPIYNTTNKAVRIRRLGPLLSQRRLRFLQKSPSTKLLVDQLRDFPLGDHDDGPDALEMAIGLAGDLRTGVPDDGLGDNLLRNRS
jgi:predicted phage terminase large subunit-like protein